jgi:SAM-dependent methyltransferase
MTAPGPAGDFDYDAHGRSYASVRRPDPRIEAMVHAALGPARSVLNVGAGAGSYEPEDRIVLAVEPSAVMRSQRPRNRVPAIDAVAERLPFDDDAFDAVMAMVTVHQWPDVVAGLREVRRVARGPVVVLTFDPDELERLWLAAYAPELYAVERRRFPSLAAIGCALGGRAETAVVPIPFDCTDGFAEAFYGRPERFLDPAVRAAQSGWGFVDDAEEARAVASLESDLASGRWDDRFGHLRRQPEFEGSLRLVVSTPHPR